MSAGEALVSFHCSLAIAPNDDKVGRWRDELQARVKALGS